MARGIARSLAVVSEVAAGQWGLLTTAQAGRQGVTRLQLARLADAGVLERVDRGVYATTAAPVTQRALRAAWLALDPTRTAEERLADPVVAGVASHTSAAGLHGLGDLLDDVPELTLPHRKQTRRGVRLHRLTLTERDITLVDGMPTTTPERTAVDLLRDGHDPDHVAQIIGQGVHRGVMDLDDLASRLEPLARRHGRANGRALVDHLLDVVGLSAAAVTRELAASPAGQELINVGRLAGITEMLAELLPKLDTSTVLGRDTLTADLGRLVGLVTTADAVHAREDGGGLASPTRTALLAMAGESGLRATIEAAHDPAGGDKGQVSSPPEHEGGDAPASARSSRRGVSA